MNIDLMVGQVMGELTALKESLKEISLMLKEIHSTTRENEANIRYLLADCKDLHKKYHEVKGYEIVLECHDKRISMIENAIKDMDELKKTNEEIQVDKEVKRKFIDFINNGYIKSIILVIIVLAGSEALDRFHSSHVAKQIVSREKNNQTTVQL